MDEAVQAVKVQSFQMKRCLVSLESSQNVIAKVSMNQSNFNPSAQDKNKLMDALKLTRALCVCVCV